MENVFIEGVGSTKFGQHSNRTAVDLAVEASLNAIEDAKVDLDKIGTVNLGNFVSVKRIFPIFSQELIRQQILYHFEVP